MTRQTRIIAAALAAAVALVLALLMWRARGGDAAPRAQKAPAPAEVATAPGRMTADRTGDEMPPAGPQIERDPDPEGPLVLEGQVLGGEDRPIAGATVTLSSNPPRTTATETDGSFSFDKLVPRSYSLTARKEDQVGGPVVHALRERGDPAVIRLVQGASIEVTVVAAAGGKPIAGAAVGLRGDDALTATTDAAGLARLRGVPPGSLAGVSARASGFASGESLVRVPEGAGQVAMTRIQLRAGAAVSGIVVNDAGRPIAGARVGAHDVSAPFELRDPRDQATTDDEGAFTLPAVAAGTYRFGAVHPKYAPTASETRTVDGSTPVSDLRIAMARGGLLAGRVQDVRGAAVPWATIRVGPHRSGGRVGAEFPTRQVVADDQGGFVLDGLPRDELLALATSEEAASAPVPVDLSDAAEKRDLLLRLDVAGRIGGIVVDSAGQPVAEAQVTAYPDFLSSGSLDDFSLRGPSVESSDGGGRFEFRGLPDAEYQLSAGRSGTGRPFGQRSVKARTGATGVKLVLDTDGTVRGRARFEDGSSPAQFTVSVGLAAGQPVSSREGAFELAVPPGSHDVILRGPDFTETVVRDVVVTPAKAVDVGVVRLTRGRVVTGRVLGPDGAPIAGATVLVGEQILGDGKSLSAGALDSFADQMGIRRGESDASGHFRIGGIRGDKELVIAAEHEELGRSAPAVIPAGPESLAFDLSVAAVGSVAGTVRAGGKPASAAQVVATASTAAGQNALVTTGQDGSYQIDRLAAGAYKVTAVLGQGATATMTSRALHIEAGERARLDLDIPIGDITLSVTVEPAEGARVDTSQVFLFSGSVSVTTARELTRAAAAREGGARMLFASGSAPARFTELTPEASSICVIPITGDMNDPQFVQRLQQNIDTLKVYCKPYRVAPTPKAQSTTAVVPGMDPFPAPK